MPLSVLRLVDNLGAKAEWPVWAIDQKNRRVLNSQYPQLPVFSPPALRILDQAPQTFALTGTRLPSGTCLPGEIQRRSVCSIASENLGRKKKMKSNLHGKLLLVLIFSCWLNLQTARAQETVQTTVQDDPPIQIPTSPFNDSSAIHAQQDRFKAMGAMLDYGVNVSTQCKTSLSDFQTRLTKAIAANSLGAARQILAVSEQTVAQAQAINAQVFRFTDHNTGSPAGRAHNTADANLAAAKQTLAGMEAAVASEAAKEQAAEDARIKAADAALKAAAETWDQKITGSLGELSACFAGDAPPSGVNCNVFAGRTLETVYGVSDFKATDGHYLSANEIADFLVTSPNWTLVGSADSQKVLDQAANSAGSRPVVAVWRNPDPDLTKHGHVALIGPGPLQPSGWVLPGPTTVQRVGLVPKPVSNPVHLNVPNSSGFSMDNVTARYIGDKLSRAFGNDKKSAVQIYVRSKP